jgi:integrase
VKANLPICPECTSQRLFKDGVRKTISGDVQRYLCKDCGFRFSENGFAKSLSMTSGKGASCQIGAARNAHGQVINLAAIEPLKEGPAGATEKSLDAKGKIVEYAWWLKKDGKSDATIEGRVKLLKTLSKRGANFYDPETVKEVIAKQTWGNGRKNNAVDAYSSFLKMAGGKWNPPLYQCIRKIPFIPKETEIDQLIAGCTKRMATFLQTLKETGARCGEIWQLKWGDIDFESKVVNITAEKQSNPRVTHLSNKLLEMLNKLPKTYGDRIFSSKNMRVDNFGTLLSHQRKRLANKLSNPRLLKIHFHTLRYWKGTMLYHETKDMYYVMQRLGHKSIKNTLLYVQLEEALFQGETNYISKVAKTEKEICSLVEAGFEYVTEFQGTKIFRKRKL